MTLQILSPDLVRAIHDTVLYSAKSLCREQDKRLELALAHIDNRIAFGMVEDVFDLAAAYAMAIARGHCFNDGNKRTAHQAMDACLDLNGIEIAWQAEEVDQIIIRCAQGLVEEGDLAEWLRGKVD